MFGFGPLMMIVFWGCILFFILRMFRHGSCKIGHCGTHHVGYASSDAMSILKERYAKGEITKEEFTSMKEDIK
jgi:uncharacterized membrane protein